MTEGAPGAASFMAAARRLLAPRVASRFALIGISATILYFVLFVGADWLLSARARGWPAWPLSLGAYALAALFSYFGHRLVSFGSTRPHALALARFVPVTIAGLLVAAILPALISDWFGGPRWLAAALTCVLVPVMNAILLSWLVFPPEAERPDAGDGPVTTALIDADGPRQALQLAACALVVMLIAATFIAPGFVTGEGEAWKHALSDRATSLVGYLHFIVKGWALPLFHIGDLSTPEGMSLVNSDSIPLLAIVGRLMHSLFGVRLNLFGLFMLGCFVLNALLAVVIARRFGVLDLTRQLAIAVIFASLPFWLMRYYHISLMAHAVILLAVLVYLRAGNAGLTWRSAGTMAAVAAAASLIHIYLWAMVMMVAGAMIARGLFRRGGIEPRGIAMALGLCLVSFAVVWGAGYFDLRGGGENTGYMSYSMNLLSPFYSSHSGFNPRAWKMLRLSQEQHQAWGFFASQRPDATGAQYVEGMNYLGAGVLALVAISLVALGRANAIASLRRHGWLVLVALVALLFAITPHLTFGSHVLRLWTPDGWLLSVLSSFRASGRFAWLPSYLLILAAVMVVARGFPLHVSRLLLVAAAVVQLVDTHPLRSAIRLDTFGSIKLFIEEAWRPVLADVRQIVILPSFECGDEAKGVPKTALHLMAARLGPIPINSASQSRSTKDCRTEFGLLDGGMRPGWIYFFFNTDPPDDRIKTFQTLHAGQCRPFGFGTVCREAGRTHYDACADELGRVLVPACAARARP